MDRQLTPDQRIELVVFLAASRCLSWLNERPDERANRQDRLEKALGREEALDPEKAPDPEKALGREKFDPEAWAAAPMQATLAECVVILALVRDELPKDYSLGKVGSSPGRRPNPANDTVVGLPVEQASLEVTPEQAHWLIRDGLADALHLARETQSSPEEIEKVWRSVDWLLSSLPPRR